MHSKTLEEAKRHIEHLLHRSDSAGNENVVFETEKTKKAWEEKIRAYVAIKWVLDQAKESWLTSGATLAFLSATLDARLSELEAAIN